ncbi:flagellar motor switch protein FliN [Granulosicoccus sp.]|jgi:flagellar motor switch protein FliN/FliY|nr:flagellar motor switch protein FliN [Granulosicoccus sp.]MDB4224381.1 flagellar motor switch protein FliN [Granulosicoccus sp.]
MSEENTASTMMDSEGSNSEESSSVTQPVSNDADNTDLTPSANESHNVSVQPVTHPEIDVNQPVDGPTADLSMILDIPVTLSMEIGQTRISISDLLKLGKNSVIELQRMADEPMDVLVNGTLVARGEAVVVGDRFGIRLTDVISPQERLKKFT